jgi:Asp-tRNA(Asn)/Glu-tRNA(Gln) amidotransferase A subunit family amidase
LSQLMDEHGLEAWIAPSAVGPAPAGLDSTGDPVMNLPWTNAGMPVVNLPSGATRQGLPLGLQVIARRGADEALLNWAEAMTPAVGRA